MKKKKTRFNSKIRTKVRLCTETVARNLNLDVAILSMDEFRRRLYEEKLAKKLAPKLPASYDLADGCFGSSVQKPPSINIDSLFEHIELFEESINIELTINQIVLVMVIQVIHEHAEAKLRYRHCMDRNCPMSQGLHVYHNEGIVKWSTVPCKRHTKLNKILSSININNLCPEGV